VRKGKLRTARLTSKVKRRKKKRGLGKADKTDEVEYSSAKDTASSRSGGEKEKNRRNFLNSKKKKVAEGKREGKKRKSSRLFLFLGRGLLLVKRVVINKEEGELLCQSLLSTNSEVKREGSKFSARPKQPEKSAGWR